MNSTGRAAASPSATLVRAVRDIASIYGREKPDIVHHVSLKPVVIGSVATILCGVPRVVNALTGLGSLFTSNSSKIKILRAVLRPFLRLVLTRSQSVLLLQNKDDLAKLERLGYVSPNTVIIRGSGIDLNYYTPQPFIQRSVVTAAFVGRNS